LVGVAILPVCRRPDHRRREIDDPTAVVKNSTTRPPSSRNRRPDRRRREIDDPTTVVEKSTTRPPSSRNRRPDRRRREIDDPTAVVENSTTHRQVRREFDDKPAGPFRNRPVARPALHCC